MSLLTNLIAAWKLDESSGNAADSSGNGFTLTNNNTTPYAAALINNGADFNGTNQSMNNNSVLASTGYPRTFAGWGNPDSVATNDRTFFSLSDGAIHYYILKIRDSDDHIVFRSNNNTDAGDVDTGVVATAGTWYNYAVIQNSATSVTIYINNTLTNTAATTFTATVSQFYIGYLGRSSVWFFDGKQDIIGVWNRAWDATDVSQYYNGGAGLQYPFTLPTSIKTVDGLAYASVKTVNGLAVASVKTIDGLA